MNLRRASVGISVLLFLSTFYLSTSIVTENARATTLYVGGTGPGNYTLIQDAINAADAGDLVYVYRGFYHERLQVHKSIFLMGEDREITVIDGDMNGDVINISADWVSVTGFTIVNSGSSGMYSAGIRVYGAMRSRISDNNISANHPYGIYLQQSLFCTVSDNFIANAWRAGVFLDTSLASTFSANTISENKIGVELVLSGGNTFRQGNVSYNQLYGFHLTESDSNTIDGNTMNNHIQLEQSDDNTISNSVAPNNIGSINLLSSNQNTISRNHMVVSLISSEYNIIVNNSVTGSTDGIFLDGSDHNIVSGNTAYSNFRYGITVESSMHNTISDNTAFDNIGSIHIKVASLNTISGNRVQNSRDGIVIESSGRNTISDNSATGNDNGIHLDYATGNTVVGNIVHGNDWGIYLEHSNSNYLIDNNATSNGEGIIFWRFSYGNTAAWNNLTNNGNGIYVWGCDNHVLVNNTVSGGSYGIFANEAHNTVITDNYASDNKADGIFVWMSHNSTVINNTALSNEAFGIYVWSSNHTIVANNNASYNYNGIGLVTSDATVTDNTLYLNEWDAMYIGASTSVTARNNTMVGGGLYMRGFYLEYWNTHRIDLSNTIDGLPVLYRSNASGGSIPPLYAEVILASCTDMIIDGHNFGRGSVGIELGFSSNITVLNTSSTSQKHQGFFLAHSDNNTIVGNVLINNILAGIELDYSANNTIRNNSMSSNSAGLELDHSNWGNLVSGNSIANCGTGVDFWVGNHYNNISGNLISMNSNGVHLLAENENNTVSDNIILSNHGFGVIIGSIFSVENRNNRVFHNNIVDNDQIGWGAQGYDSTDENQWDDGYPSGGNYWSDYAGADDFWGVLQNQPGSDGIGDSAYFVNNDRDGYPLMSPIGVVPTRPPVVLEANLIGGNSEHVMLTWQTSPDDGSGFKSVVGYQVLRGSIYDCQGDSYQVIANLSGGSSFYADQLAGEGNPDNYFYRICALDSNNNIACSLDQAGKYTRPLSEGPNLVSIPPIQSNERVEKVLRTVNFDNVWAYNASDSLDPWKWYMRSKPYDGDLEMINHTMAVWINVTGESNLTVAGIVPLATTLTLRSGWNLIGYPSYNITYTVGDLKTEICATRVEGFDQLNPPYHLKALGDEEVLEPGFGYWVMVESDMSWAIKNS